MPCNVCRHHYYDYLNLNPPNIHSRDELLDWLFVLYNQIKQRENYSIEFDKFIQKASDYDAKYFWELLFYICSGYETNTFDNQLAYKQFFEYLGYLKPYKKFQKAFRDISIDPYLLNSHTLLYYITILYKHIYE